MMPPPFPFFPPGMSHGMPHMSMMPYNSSGGIAPWLGDSMYPGGMTSSGDGVPTPADDHIDIFGKPVHKVPAPTKQSPISRPQAKPDLFEPQ